MKINSYVSIPFLLIFLPAAALLYDVFPKKIRPFILLAASYIFFFFISEFLIAYLIFSTLLIYFCALLLEKIKKKRTDSLSSAESREEKKLIKKKSKRVQLTVLIVCIVINVGLLAAMKYVPFFASVLKNTLGIFGVNLKLSISKYAAPIGISFYTLQAISYIHDVYKEKIKADKNFCRVALFMSFFPVIMEGPICRYSDTAEALWAGKRIYYKNFTFGLQRIIFGLMKKIVIADRLNIFVKTVFRDFDAFHYDGFIIALGAILYTLELYMEFSGTIDVVIGTGEIFGITIPENFRQPFFSKSITEFWQRWHITLGTWLRDYVFYPVSLSKGMKNLTRKARKKLGRNYGPMPATIIAFFCVWFCNGLWHGAGTKYIVFGMYHFVLISLGSLVLPLSTTLFKKLKIDKSKMPYKIFAIIRTSLLVFVGELIFNSQGVKSAFRMIKAIFTRFSFKPLLDGSVFTLGLDKNDILIIFVATAIVFAVGIIKEKGNSPRELIAAKPVFVRWPIYMALILFIVIFGAYGAGYIPIDPIYANF